MVRPLNYKLLHNSVSSIFPVAKTHDPAMLVFICYPELYPNSNENLSLRILI
jgi:hypothetical protein